MACLLYDLTCMAVSLQKKKVRGHTYWYARECQRVDGKPKIVWQKYLGRAEDIANAAGAPSQPPAPREVTLSDFAAPAALYDVTCRDLRPRAEIVLSDSTGSMWWMIVRKRCAGI